MDGYEVEDDGHVDLELRGLGDDEAAEVAGLLRANAGAVSVINLGGNLIGEEGASTIAAALPACGSCLLSVDLRFNQVGDAGTAAIAEVLRAGSVPLQVRTGRVCGRGERREVDIGAGPGEERPGPGEKKRRRAGRNGEALTRGRCIVLPLVGQHP